MKNILLLALCLFGFQSFAQDDLLKSEWTIKPKIVDGNIVEPRKPYNLYDSDTKIFFRVANDSSNIYLCFKISDKFEQRKILKSGMVVSLSSKGGKKSKASISYPLADSNDDSSPEIQPELMRKKDVKMLRDEVKLKKSLLELSGFATENGLVSVDPNSFIYVGIDWDEKEAMYYDIIIPFTEFYGDKIVISDLTASTLMLNVKVNAMKRSRSGESNRPQGMPEGGTRGGGIRPGGGVRTGGGSIGMRSEMGEHRGQDASNMFSSQEFKQKFKLTIK